MADRAAATAHLRCRKMRNLIFAASSSRSRARSSGRCREPRIAPRNCICRARCTGSRTFSTPSVRQTDSGPRLVLPRGPEIYTCFIHLREIQTMNIQLRRSIAIVLALVCAGLARPLPAQQPTLTPEVLGQITDAVFAALIAPDSSLSRIPVAKRRVVFDYDRTAASFERVGTPPAVFSKLRLRTPVARGTKELLADCAQGVLKPCSKLAWRVYSWLAPVSVTDSEVVVRAHFMWADRGRAKFQDGVAPKGRGRLVGFASEVFLVRGQDGIWRFSKLGRTFAGD